VGAAGGPHHAQPAAGVPLPHARRAGARFALSVRREIEGAAGAFFFLFLVFCLLILKEKITKKN
jgi:hypothetical protein